ncbi:DNA recombination protein RmuC [Candidatus Ichthyocystis hellenicum]|uniref:DNA recombination protein RmuC n=1 Tax=Candidatus Ichthyocystis hellenicum TaxID=1561003 RepID=UPI000B2FC362|nr:DNA recombination protein RmuC [Candidatus Ichthyocystis hellenicum]
MIVIVSILLLTVTAAVLFYTQKKSHRAECTARDRENVQLQTQIDRLEKELSTSKEEINHHITKEQQLLQDNTRLEAEAKYHSKLSENTESIISLTKKFLQDQMALVAHDVIKESRQELVSAHEKNMVEYINPLQQKIDAFERYISEAYHKENQQRCTLKQEVTRLFEATLTVSKDAQNLATALKGNSKIQGNWGEMILERVLSSSGLRKNHEYKTQVTLMDEENNYLRPDVIVYLPDNKHIIIDSKVSLRDYQRYTEETENSSQFLKQHTLCIKQHIKELSQKHYDALKDIDTLSFVILFIPIEPAFIAALSEDASILDGASQKRIAIASPSTLMPILKTVHLLWKHDQQNKNALEIAQHGAQLYDKCTNFIESLEEIGQKIQSLSKCYETTTNRLYKGKGNLLRHMEKMKEMGIEPRKTPAQSVKNRCSTEQISEI